MMSPERNCAFEGLSECFQHVAVGVPTKINWQSSICKYTIQVQADGSTHDLGTN